MAIDIDNPATWKDLDLAKAAATGEIELEPESPKEPEVKAPEPEVTPEPEGVIRTQDGKHEIPYDVLKSTRESLATTKAQLEALTAELNALKAAPPAAPPAAAPAAALPAEVEARLAKIKENWGDDIADQARHQYEMDQRLAQQQVLLDQLNQQLTQQTQKQQRTEQVVIEDAIAASPVLNRWALATDQTWFGRATEAHTLLMRTDPHYASADWFERMKLLPQRVEALFGAAAQTVPVDTVAAKARVKAVMDQPPSSLSKLSGGTTPEQPELDKLTELKGNALTAHMTKLAADPRKLEAYLRNFG